MEMAIIEAVLALVALYLVMALLASQLNEQMAGLWGTRQKYTGKAVDEAFPDDEKGTRIAAFYAYAPVYSLSKGSGRPSAIPPQLFAEAWLAVMYGKGKPPRADFRAPSEFIASLDLPAGRLKELVDWLAAGYADDWDRFEHRIETWYGDICDRAEGWYKRFTALRLWGISLLLAGLLNVDTHHVFKFLMTHDEQRLALANLGELINATMGAASGPAGPPARATPPAPAGVPASPAERALAANGELATALAAIDRAMGDPVVAGAGDDLQAAAAACRPHMTATASFDRSESWPVLLMGVRTLMGEAVLAATSPQAAPGAATAPLPRRPHATPLPPASSTPKAATSSTASPSSATSPGSAALTAVVPARAADDGGAVSLSADEVAARWRTASVCLDRVSQWVDATWARARTPAARKALEDGRAALARTQRYIETERQRSTATASLKRRYLADPQGVRDCSEQAGADRAAFAECLRTTRALQLPIGWPAPIEQLCTVSAVPEGATFKPEVDATNCADLPANPALGVAAQDAKVDGGRLFGMAVGWLITAFMVSLGAPFWFGVLGKVANLRLAGSVRGSRTKAPGDSPPAADALRAGAPPLPTTAAATAPRVATTAGVAVPAAPFSDARNSFEQTLRLQDISRLQKALDAPSTGRLDELTRQRLRERLGNTEELDPGSFEAITGRRAPVAVVAAPAPTGVWTLGHNGGADVRALSQTLNRCFPMLKPLDEAGTVFNTDLRSRVVLHRLLTDAETDWSKRQVVLLAAQRDPALDTLDAARRAQLLAAAAPVDLGQLPAWFCTALGELGVSELPGAAQSNPRIDEYIRTLGDARMANDETAWCGAFAGWVMQRNGMLEANARGPRVQLLAAKAWQGFGEEVPTFGELQPGDICVMERADGGHHVAFFVALPPGPPDGSAYLLGGNQGSGPLAGAVTLVRWRGVEKGTWRRARL